MSALLRVALLSLMLGIAWSAGGQTAVLEITADGNDGMEETCNGQAVWHNYNPYVTVTRWNWMGWYPVGVPRRFDTALRFWLDDSVLKAGDNLVYARLVFSGSQASPGAGTLYLQGIAGSAHPFDPGNPCGPLLPSAQPKTTATVTWNLPMWPKVTPHGNYTEDSPRAYGVYRYSPNIAPILNEIINGANWPASGGYVGLVIGPDPEANDGAYWSSWDSHFGDDPTAMLHAARLEIYRDQPPTLLGGELLGRITTNSVALKATPVMHLYASVEYRPDHQGRYDATTPAECDPDDPNQQIDVVLSELAPDTRYYYHVRCCLDPNDPTTCASGPEGTFHTARPKGSDFSFVVQADVHWSASLPVSTYTSDIAMYQQALANELNDPCEPPDFVFDLGDANIMDQAANYAQAVALYLEHRQVFSALSRYVPLFNVLGNHEQEKGWERTGENSRPVWAAKARRLVQLYPPDPNDARNPFWLGQEDVNDPYLGVRGNYYAFEWGDCLFVALDPFGYTLAPPEQDRWNWSLGYAQYDWLRTVLASSTATFKFVLAHHMTGGLMTNEGYYGRGGVEAARWYEWGGWEDPDDPNFPDSACGDPDGPWCFNTHRARWGVPVHQLLLDHHVAAFLHGHDHCFAKQALDGLVYLEVPRPADYDNGGWMQFYSSGSVFNNSGHVRATVHQTPTRKVTFEYVRTRLNLDPYEPIDPDDPDVSNGDVSYTFAISDCNHNCIPDAYDILDGTCVDADFDGLPEQCAGCIGDLNCDGMIDYRDINPFVLYLCNYAAWQNMYPCCDPRNGDINCDGVYGQSSFGDVNPFVALLGRCAGRCACPGPVTCPGLFVCP
jgi:hypothetical protein